MPDVDAIEQGSPNTKAIIGGVVGGVAGLGIAIAAIAFFMRRKRKRERIDQLQQQQRRLSSPMETGNSYDDDFYGDPYRHSLMSSNNGEYGWSSSSNTNTSNTPLFTYDTAVEAYRNSGTASAAPGIGGQQQHQQTLVDEQPIVARRPNTRGDGVDLDIPHYRD